MKLKRLYMSRAHEGLKCYKCGVYYNIWWDGRCPNCGHDKGQKDE